MGLHGLLQGYLYLLINRRWIMLTLESVVKQTENKYENNPVGIKHLFNVRHLINETRSWIE
jgi:hypothetical protein